MVNPMEKSIEKIRTLKNKMVSRRENNELVLIPMVNDVADMNEILILNEVAGFIWDNIEKYNTFNDILDDVVTNFNVEKNQAQNDINEFLREFDN